MGWQLQLLSGPGVNPASWGVQSDLTGATGRKVTVYLDQAHEIAFTMNAEHPEAQLVEELLCDVVAAYDDGTGSQPLARCRVGPSSDSGDGTSVTSQFRALSYRDLLRRKILYAGDAGLAVAASDLEAVGWLLIGQAQGRANGTVGIVRGTRDAFSAAAAATPALTLDAGMAIGEQIDKLFVDSPAGYDWDITAGLIYQTYLRPRRSNGTGGLRFLLDYGGSVATFQRTVEPGDYANAVRVSGGTPQNPPVGYTVPVAAAQSADVTAGVARQGRWEKQVGDTDLFTAARTLARAQQLVADAQVIQPTYTVTLKPGMWHGPADLWIGDVCPLRITAGRLNVATELIVQSMAFDLGDDGDDTVTVSLAGLSPTDRYFLQQRRLLSDVARLERR